MSFVIVSEGFLYKCSVYKACCPHSIWWKGFNGSNNYLGSANFKPFRGSEQKVQAMTSQILPLFPLYFSCKLRFCQFFPCTFQAGSDFFPFPLYFSCKFRLWSQSDSCSRSTSVNYLSLSWRADSVVIFEAHNDIVLHQGLQIHQLPKDSCPGWSLWTHCP